MIQSTASIAREDRDFDPVVPIVGTRGFVDVEDIPSPNPNPEEILLLREAGIEEND
ncbi:MAG: hypothetical protein Q7S36_01735 [Candidatus Liptonbacteria bacterium]|nr:hypothetical protein [Candidatus Liptonbacteria bacterium]